MHRGLVWEAAEAAQAVYIDDDFSHPGASPAMVEAGVQNVAFLPLTGMGTDQYVIGMVQRQAQRPWTQGARELLQTAARTVQITLERRHHLLELERAALVDAPTGLGQRRAFERDLERELERSRRSGKGVGVLTVDLDGLKQINDALGHDRGDALLVSFVQTLSASLRAKDQVYRLGGEYAAIADRPERAADPGDAGAARGGQPRLARDLRRRKGERMYLQKMYLQKQEHRQARRADLEA
ncbi:GGDEF domain-containing protein [Deinococcus sp.]|uniref:GGDEF domain-containing protein n=1 Tax=Deinococcus sp. TaxID=47478 RepID=UPI003C7CBD0B